MACIYIVSIPALTTGQLKEALEFEGTSGHLYELEDAVYPVGSAAFCGCRQQSRSTHQMLGTSCRKVNCSLNHAPCDSQMFMILARKPQ
jgi:hypothetical protein